MIIWLLWSLISFAEKAILLEHTGNWFTSIIENKMLSENDVKTAKNSLSYGQLLYFHF